MVKPNRATIAEVRTPVLVAEHVATSEQRFGRSWFAIDDLEHKIHESLRKAESEHPDADVIVTVSVLDR